MGSERGLSPGRTAMGEMRRNRSSAVSWRASEDQAVNQSKLLIANTFHDTRPITRECNRLKEWVRSL